MKRLPFLKCLPFLLWGILSSCDQDIEPNIPVNLKAIAGENQEAVVNREVLLQGKVEGGTGNLHYNWAIKSKPEGSQSVIEESDKITANFIPDLSGIYLLEFTVSKGSISAKDELTILAKPDGSNPPFEPNNYISRDINEDTIWEDKYEDPAIPDYIVTKEIAVNANLTIQPGVVVHFKENAGLKVNGALLASGLSDKRIFLIGEEPSKGYWKGVLINSNAVENRIEHVYMAHGGGAEFLEMPGAKANLLVNGQNQPSQLKLANSNIRESKNYGMYMAPNAILSLFENNSFSENEGPAAFVPAHQVHFLDFHSRFKDKNGFDGVETSGELNLSTSVTWSGFNDRSKYLISSDLTIKSGMEVMPGAAFEISAGKMIHVTGNGYLKAVGNQSQRIDFTARVKDGNHNWKGIFFQSSHLDNILSRADVSFAGSSSFSGIPQKANIAVSGTLILRMSRINYSGGYGVYATHLQAVNEDIATSNVFGSTPLGYVFPESLANPGLPSLKGDWVDWWSFNEELFHLDPNFYNRNTGLWFGGAAGPWHSNQAGGFGIRFSEDGKFTWLIAEKYENDPSCISYAAEYINGTFQKNAQTLLLQQNYWRSKFYLSCETDQNYDENVQPGLVQLKYEIKRVFHPLSGLAFWELKITNLDNSTFSYFKL
ncbi:hypothetical protein [Cecembia rubra]|nr:hypothetical protein [Cecembia rubra]